MLTQLKHYECEIRKGSHRVARFNIGAVDDYQAKSIAEDWVYQEEKVDRLEPYTITVDFTGFSCYVYQA